MSFKEELKARDEETQNLLEARIIELDSDISEILEEIKPLQKERRNLQNRLNLLLGKVPTPRARSNNNPGPVRTEIIKILQLADGLMRRKEIFVKLNENGYEITTNHFGTTLSNLKKSGKIVNPEIGYYGLPSHEEDSEK